MTGHAPGDGVSKKHGFSSLEALGRNQIRLFARLLQEIMPVVFQTTVQITGLFLVIGPFPAQTTLSNDMLIRVLASNFFPCALCPGSVFNTNAVSRIGLFVFGFL